ncbi:hypothetical protein B0H16DRAFT_254937 [Mycena metata]|uniref:Uncharacterized protein n=1 Tax=Mycena metata TaxID=1033252 RepID=A0AAD7JS65_9AGAR|nr:hypothetical protein B0H16DRAFT_254937 [Mycena metata]
MGSPRHQIPRHPRLAAAGFLACRLRPLPSGQETSRSTQCAHATIRPLAERLNRTQYNHSSPLRHSHYPTAIYPRQRHPRRRARIQPIPHSACCCRCRHHSRGHLPPLDTASRFTEALDASLRPLVDPGGFFRWMISQLVMRASCSRAPFSRGFAAHFSFFSTTYYGLPRTG